MCTKSAVTMAATLIALLPIASAAAPDRWNLMWTPKAKASSPVHIIYTTDCRRYQHWQAVALEHTWARLRHPGSLTRIVSGCADAAARRAVNSTAFRFADRPRFHVHFTPTYVDGDHELMGAKNRPPSIRHWLEHARIDEQIVAILDPDMLLLHPLANRYAPFARKGRVIGQEWGLGRHPCPPHSSCTTGSWQAWKDELAPERNLSDTFIRDHYSSGPPWLPVNFLQSTFSDRTRCIAQLRPGCPHSR